MGFSLLVDKARASSAGLKMVLTVKFYPLFSYIISSDFPTISTITASTPPRVNLIESNFKNTFLPTSLNLTSSTVLKQNIC